MRSASRLTGIPSPGKGLSGFPGGRGLAEMPREEPRDLVEGLVGLVQFPEVELEDVRAFRGHLQGHVNVGPGLLPRIRSSPSRPPRQADGPDAGGNLPLTT